MNRRASDVRRHPWFVAIVVLCALAPWAGVYGIHLQVGDEREATVQRERELRDHLIQETVNAVARDAFSERLRSCRADEEERAAERRFLLSVPPQFLPSPIPDYFLASPRNCVKEAEDYAADVRAAGPLVSNKETP